jgi:hypothetical protein
MADCQISVLAIRLGQAMMHLSGHYPSMRKSPSAESDPATEQQYATDTEGTENRL